ncbi:Bardet-Biedl syndrome 5 protein homolog isoform X1 [Hypanus sabinus]|uniref:Bardet-Biedl syndrome 5 protein homolog isoform X1 n=1 Tax=Hypanus sabinus TaxID=79690 RepID=UPI0028C503FA|nr:Bardet-Biedl syndrome 5 protein homolog isoform X1 [Hypanus sabinus]
MFTKWSPLSLSLIGRINAIKMVILPKFLYIFSSGTNFYSEIFFNVDSKISSYIWQNKNPRLAKIHLQKTKNEGGLALPNFRFYYWAVNIRYLLCWLKDWDGSSGPHWVSLEIKSVPGYALGSILGTSLPFALSKLLKQIDNLIVKHTLRIWFQFQKFFGLTQFVLNIPIVSNCFFHPSIIDQAYSAWKTKGLLRFSDLFLDNCFMSFEQLSNKYNLPRFHFFRYLQIRHFLNTVLPTFPNFVSSDILESLFELNPFQKGLISKLYNIIMKIHSEPLYKTKNDWERELNLIIPIENWDRILQLVNTFSICAKHSLIQFKVVHRAHISKDKLAHFYSYRNPICDRCQFETASLTHIFWSCPLLKKYWKDIFDIISMVLNIDLQPHPITAIFGLPMMDLLHLSSSACRMIAFLTLMARRSILLNWKEINPPTVFHWFSQTMLCLNLEKIRSGVFDASIKFEKIWRPFIQYFHMM